MVIILSAFLCSISGFVCVYVFDARSAYHRFYAHSGESLFLHFCYTVCYSVVCSTFAGCRCNDNFENYFVCICKRLPMHAFDDLCIPVFALAVTSVGVYKHLPAYMHTCIRPFSFPVASLLPVSALGVV